MPEGRLITILKEFAIAQADVILVGGLAAVLQGVPMQTYDVDLVYSREPENLNRLLIVLEHLDAIFRLQPERRIRPTESHLKGSGHLNLISKHGPIDLLSSIGIGSTFEQLRPYAENISVGENTHILVLNLEAVITSKEQVGGEKDRAVLPLLRRTLILRNSSKP